MIVAPAVAFGQTFGGTAVYPGSPGATTIGSYQYVPGTIAESDPGGHSTSYPPVATPTSTASGSEYVFAVCGYTNSQIGSGPPCANGAVGQVSVVPLTSFATASSVTAETSRAEITETMLQTQIGNLSTRVDGLQQFSYQARIEARQGVASAMAMASASMPSAPGRTSWVVNVAEFRDQSAAGGSAAHRFETRFPLAITAGFGVSGMKESGARIGLEGEF